jgi:hypothetical protein
MLQGSLVYHDGIRKWFELRLIHPTCGQASIQLIALKNSWASLEVLRGCRVKSTGPIDFSTTGYYSLDTWQSVERIEAEEPCTRQLSFPDHSTDRPEQAIQEYRVEMHVEYALGDQPIVFRITSGGRELRPWQAYASYMLTGGEVLYGYCGEGFIIDRVFGTALANPAHFAEPHSSEDMAMFEPETAAAAGKSDLDLGYTCVREQ